MKHYTYTKKDFKDFEMYIHDWINKFGITEWDYEVMHNQLDGSAARTTYNNKAKIACFQLTVNIEYDFCHQSDLNKLALHEVIHLLLADFGYVLAETKDQWADLVIAHEHAVVMRLLKVIK